MAAKERIMTVQKGTLQDSDRLNDQFWDAVPPHERLAAVWPLVCDFAQWSKTDAGESRLQRSVLRVERR
jgi:hypothetical protein